MERAAFDQPKNLQSYHFPFPVSLNLLSSLGSRLCCVALRELKNVHVYHDTLISYIVAFETSLLASGTIERCPLCVQCEYELLVAAPPHPSRNENGERSPARAWYSATAKMKSESH